MLSRVARQKNALFYLRKANAYRAFGASSALRLQSNSTRLSPSTATPNSSTTERRRRPSFQSQRHLATAADPSPLDSGSHLSSLEDSWRSAPELSAFDFTPAEFDPSSLIILDEMPQSQPKPITRRVRGLGGDEDEMLANFEMSLKVGRLDRAATLINRLNSSYSTGSPEYLALHNRYLKEMVSHMIITRDQDLIPALQKWFEVDMPMGGVQPDATTFAVMIRMALRMLHGSKRDRSVRRYWDLAKKADLHEDLLAEEFLTDLDLGELSSICFTDLSNPTLHQSSLNDGLNSQPTDNMAEVLAADQRGLGLSSLRESLSLFEGNAHVSLPENFHGTKEEQQELYSQLRQQRLEADTIQSAMKRWKHEVENMSKRGFDNASGKKSMSGLINQWHTDLVSRIKEEIKLAEKAEKEPVRTEEAADRLEYGVFLQSMDAERLAAVTLLSIMATFSRGGMDKGIKVTTVAAGIGREIQDELIAERILKDDPIRSLNRMNTVRKMLADRKGKEGCVRWKRLSGNVKKEDTFLNWTPRVTVRTGAVLLSLMLDVSKTPVTNRDLKTGKKTTVTQPAFHHAYQITYGRRVGLLHMNPEIVKMLVREPSANLIGRHLPMVCKPQPWTGEKEGGYLIYQSRLVRLTPGEALQPAYLRAALEKDGLPAIRSGLDVLGSTPWAINHGVLEVMLEAWNSGESIAQLAPLDPDLPAPPKPSADAGVQAEREWRTRMREIENQRSGYHSNRCFQNFQLEVARAFRNETFYLPHNLDFRGRAYPLPPYLNQMGADNSRGLLLFSEAKPLGASGLRWLKIQIANLAGFDKASMSEREQFTNDHVEDVLNSANTGLHGKRWWLKAEDPWQCLAACIELRNALRCSDPNEYLCRLPIHQDGSCNGLQHYAALGGDKVGAEQVNLEPSDRPSDVYTGVSEFVKQKVEEEAAAGTEIAQALVGKITRKIVKQTVMTNVYGVTFMGAMRQVRRQLYDHYPEMTPQLKKEGALYISRKIFEALGSMFTGAHEIQYWLGDCAGRISRSLSPEQIEQFAQQALRSESKRKLEEPSKKFRSTVIWTTPLGLPVVQPYRTRKSRRIRTTLQDLSVVDASSEDVISKRKQLQAFPPNFIHSLDATHMMLSAKACNEAGLTFSAVHDSFWTHAGDVDTMNRILRDAFVRMHSDDIIGRLAAEFKLRYGDHLFLAKIDANHNIGRAVRKARRVRGMQQHAKLTELLDEYRRQKLLQSDDPASQAEGREMVTAASIFESMGGKDEDVAIASTLGETAVGHIPENLATAERKPSASVDTSDPAIESLFHEVDMMDSKPVSLGEENAEPEADDEVKPAGKTSKLPYTWMWLPVTIRDVPTKGSWDVSRIKNSEYFFS